MTISLFIRTCQCKQVQVGPKCGLLNNCGGYFNSGYDNNASPNNVRKRAINKITDQHAVEITPLFDLSLYELDTLALNYLT